MSFLAYILLSFTAAEASIRTLAFVGVTGDGQSCKVRYALDADFNVSEVVVEGRYTENDTDFKTRLTEYYKRLKDRVDPKVYSSLPTTERIDGPTRMEQMDVHIATGGRLGSWIGQRAGPMQNHQRERWEFATVGERLDAPSRVILRYALRRINNYYVPTTAYTRTIDCTRLVPASPEREI